MGKARVASLPDVPTIAEQGFPDVDVAGWFAVVGPAKLPAGARSSACTTRSSPRSPRRTCKAAMAKQENVINPTTPEAAVQFFTQRAGALRAAWSRRPTSSWTDAAGIRTETLPMADLFDNPMGLMGFEFVEFASPDARHAGAGVREARLHARREAPLEGRGAVPPGRHQLHRQPRAEEPGRLLRRRARPLGLRPGVSRQGLAQGLRSARWSSARSRSRCRPGRWSCACRRSRASAARRST